MDESVKEHRILLLLVCLTLLKTYLPSNLFRADSIPNARRIVLTIALVALFASILGSTGCSSLPCWREAPFNNKQARRWYNGGLDALNKGQLNLAENCLNRAMDHNPEDPRIKMQLAETLREKGDYSEAISLLEKGIAQSTCSGACAHVLLGELYLEQGRWIPARQHAELALKIDRKHADAWVLRGMTEFAKGSMDAATTNFQRALSYDPGNEIVHMKLAEIYERTNQPMRALATVEELLRRYPETEQPERLIILKSSALLAMEHHQSAIRVLQVASQNPDASSEVFIRLGRAQLLTGQTSQARTTLNRAKQLFPGEKELDSLVADLQLENNDVATNQYR